MSLEAKKMPSRYSHLLCTSTHASSTAFSLVRRSSHNAASSWNSYCKVCVHANREHDQAAHRLSVMCKHDTQDGSHDMIANTVNSM